MDNVRISVIVAVYNRESMLDRCIDSLVYQSFQDIEIILVDDYSTDNSMAKMQEWQRLFPNKIRILVAEEKGVAYAKNTGIKAARGEYLSFVDSDDYVDYKLLERLYSKIVGEDTEMVYSPIWKINEGRKTAFGKLPIKTNYSAKDYLQTENFCLPGRLIKKELFDRFGLLPILRQGEDLVWLYHAISHMENPSAFAYVDIPGYYYEIHQDSICAQYSDQSVISDIMKGADYILKVVNPEYFDMALFFLIKRAVNLKNRRTAYSGLFDEWICSTIQKYPNIVDNITNDYFKSAVEQAQRMVMIPATLFVNGFNKAYSSAELDALKNSVYLYCNEDMNVIPLSEKNCNVEECLLVYKAYTQQNYDFVVQYFAIKACYENGGVFIDRDIVVDYPFNSLLKDPAFFGFESDERFTDKVFGCQAGNLVFKRILQTYEMPQMYEDEFAPLKQRIKTVLVGMGNIRMCSGIVRKPEYGFCLYPVDTFVYSLPYAENLHLCHYKPEAFGEIEGGSVPIKVLQSLSDRRVRLEVDKEKRATRAANKEIARYKGLADKRSEYIVRLEREQKVMLNSWSWRVSKPVRVFGSLVRKVRRFLM